MFKVVIDGRQYGGLFESLSAARVYADIIGKYIGVCPRFIHVWEMGKSMRKMVRCSILCDGHLKTQLTKKERSMKKVINGRRYDTDTAECLAEWSNGSNYNDFNYVEESLYRKKTGEFFLFGSGGPLSKYAVSTGQNSWSGSTDITPISEEEAREWVEAHANADYDDIFGAVEE